MQTTIDAPLLENWQRDFPLEPRPFAVLACMLGSTETAVINRLVALTRSGIIARVGGVFRPNTLGASTLAAISVPDFQVDSIADQLSEEPGVNHIYLRENDWNIWFVATGPDRQAVRQVLSRLTKRISLRILDLRLVTPYYIDLGFPLEMPTHERRYGRPLSVPANLTIEDGDRDLAQTLTTGLPLNSRPFLQIAHYLNRTEIEVIQRIRDLTSAGIISRLGVIVRHRALGWRSNAMVVWDVPPSRIDSAGAALASMPGINLCYRRTRYEPEWPFNLYCMVHAKSREAALDVIANVTSNANLGTYPREILFSTRCFKQTGALIAKSKEVA